MECVVWCGRVSEDKAGRQAGRQSEGEVEIYLDYHLDRVGVSV